MIQILFQISSFSLSLWPHRMQNARIPCPSSTPRACSNSYPSSWWCHPTISTCHILRLMPSIFPSIRIFSNKSVLCIRWPELQLQQHSFNEYSGLISFRSDWFDLLAVQGTLKSLLQNHSSKASILWRSAFFIVQPHIHTWYWKTIALTRWTIVGKLMSLVFNMLSRLVIAFSKE